jgi:hypothetical protein
LLSLSTLQLELTTALKADPDLTALTTSLLDKELNWYIDSDYQLAEEVTPYFLILKLPKTNSLEVNPEWALQFFVGIDWDNKPVTIDGITQYPAPKKVEDIADMMVSIIRKRVTNLSVDGTDLFIKSVNSLPIEVGETKDQQILVTMVFESERTINMEC